MAVRKPAAHVDSWYSRSATPSPARPALEGRIRCDVAVMGAGLSGLSAALELAEAGLDVVVLEAGTRETRQEYRDHHLGADMQYARSTRTTRGPIHVTVVGDVAWAESTSESSRTVEGRTVLSSGGSTRRLCRR